MSEQSEPTTATGSGSPAESATVASSAAPVASSGAPKGRGSRRGPGGGGPRRAGSGRLVPLDQLPAPDELVLFNALLAAEAEKDKAERRRRKLEQAKDQAAARVKALNADPNASKEDRAAAEAAYKEALAKLQTGPEDEDTTDAPAGDDVPPADVSADVSTADEAVPDEPVTSADMAPTVDDAASESSESPETDDEPAAIESPTET